MEFPAPPPTNDPDASRAYVVGFLVRYGKWTPQAAHRSIDGIPDIDVAVTATHAYTEGQAIREVELMRAARHSFQRAYLLAIAAFTLSALVYNLRSLLPDVSMLVLLNVPATLLAIVACIALWRAHKRFHAAYLSKSISALRKTYTR